MSFVFIQDEKAVPISRTDQQVFQKKIRKKISARSYLPKKLGGCVFFLGATKAPE